MQSTSSRLTALALAVAGTSLAAHAQQIVEKIDVEGHYANGLGTSDAASQGVVTQKLIENRPMLRPAELLEFIPGVMITQHSGDGKANQYYLRGFNLDHGTDFATFVSGMPVNMPTHAHGQGYSDLNFLIPELVSRIEYWKGPYFAASGDFASAGTARISLVDRVASPLAQVTVGKNGFRRAVVAGSGELAGGTLLAAMEAVENDGPWRVPEGLKRANGVLRYSQGTAERGWGATAMAYGSQWTSTDQIPLRTVESGALDRFGAIDPTDGGRTARYSFSMQGRMPWGRGSVEASAYAIRSRLNLFSNFTYFLDDPVRGDQFEQAEQRTVLGGEAAYRITQAFAAGREVTHTFGTQVRQDRIDPVALYHTELRERLETTREDRVRETSIAAYYENNARWTSWLRTIAGLRYDRYDFHVNSNLAQNGGKVNASIASPKWGVVVGPWARTEIFLNWGRGFHSNDARGTTISTAPSTGDAVGRVTPLVRSTGYELGLRGEWIPGLHTSFALWRLDLDSELVFVGDAGTTEASRPSRRTGIEVNSHYAVNPHLLLDLDVATSRARFTNDDPVGNRIPGSVETVVSAGVTMNDLGPWSGSLQMRHFGPRALIEDKSARSKATTLAYARVGFKLSKSLNLSLDVLNLFDRKASDIDYFYTSRLRGEPSGGLDDIHFHPVERRTFRLTIAIRF